MSNRVKEAENEVYQCLNYGGIFHDEAPTSKAIELAYEQGDLSDEIPQMRRLANALNELADALEAETDCDSFGDSYACNDCSSHDIGLNGNQEAFCHSCASLNVIIE